VAVAEVSTPEEGHSILFDILVSPTHTMFNSETGEEDEDSEGGKERAQRENR
jgi:hypothetical protein